MTRFILFLLTGMLAACGSSPPQHLPPALELAQAADKDARRALRGGDLLRAQKYFTQTLELQQSLDDHAGAAMTLINLATVTHQLHDDEKALFWLDKILLEKAPIYPSDSNMTAAFREAVILTNLTRFNEADSALQVSEKLCLQTCSLRFGIQVLRARLLLLKGNSEGALALAQETGKENEGGKEEHANALRVIAAAEENMGRHADALQHYQAALEMDKSLGMSSRIGEDLSGLSRTSSRLGHDQEAAAYARRAELVSGSQHQSAVPTGE